MPATPLRVALTAVRPRRSTTLPLQGLLQNRREGQFVPIGGTVEVRVVMVSDGVKEMQVLLSAAAVLGAGSIGNCSKFPT